MNAPALTWEVELWAEVPPTSGTLLLAPLGSAAGVRDAVTAAWPSTRWHGPDGIFESDGCTFRVQVCTSHGLAPDEADAVYVRVEGDGDPYHALALLCDATGWVAFDLQLGAPVTKTGRRSWSYFRSQPATPARSQARRAFGKLRLAGT